MLEVRWDRGASFLSGVHRDARSIRTGRDGAVFAGVVRAPMTSVLMIFEMTQDYAVIVPLMIANLVSLFIASRLQHEPIYEALAVQDGIHLPTAKTRQRPGQRRVAGIMRIASQLLPPRPRFGRRWRSSIE